MGIEFQNPISRAGQPGRSVVFTFCGPAGLIEGGSNQKIALIVDTDSLAKVQDLRTLLQNELDIDNGIDIIFRESVKGKRIRTCQKLKKACLKGAITVEFVEVMPLTQNADGSASDSQPMPNATGQPEVI
jgi:hypothetical protein